MVHFITLKMFPQAFEFISVRSDRLRVVCDEHILPVRAPRPLRPVEATGQKNAVIDDREFVVHVQAVPTTHRCQNTSSAKFRPDI